MEQSKKLKWVKGNFGAMHFLNEVTQPSNENIGKVILDKLEEATSIRGTNLWILYSDLCEKQLINVHRLCENCPTDILEDACSRQDYSGRELVEPYF